MATACRIRPGAASSSATSRTADPRPRAPSGYGENAAVELIEELGALVGCESPSADLAATAACADLVEQIGRGRLGAAPERVVTDGRVHLRWRFGRTRVVLLGHFDTVWPLGTLARWPFDVSDDRATGPGCFDMKAGLVQLFAALAGLDDLDGVAVLATSDEEIGSPMSRTLIEQTVRGAEAALVLEASADGALKTARKGVSMYTVRALGRAAHAGLEPENGVNASVELAHQLLAIAGMNRPDIGTTVTPTVLAGGTTTNTVPAEATVSVDVRAVTADEQQRVDAQIRGLQPRLPAARLVVTGGPDRPPLEPSASAALFATARAVAAELGLPELTGVAVGGGSDGNLTAGVGVPTLDGLGAVGGNAHAEGEWVSVSSMPRRAALVAGLVRRLLH
jgi:glutamate carboxypeptidase